MFINTPAVFSTISLIKSSPAKLVVISIIAPLLYIYSVVILVILHIAMFLFVPFVKDSKVNVSTILTTNSIANIECVGGCVDRLILVIVSFDV